MAARSAHFDALLNFRDVGLTVNSLSSARYASELAASSPIAYSACNPAPSELACCSELRARVRICFRPRSNAAAYACIATDETTLADRKKLLDEYGIRHVIDLRTKCGSFIVAVAKHCPISPRGLDSTCLMHLQDRAY